MRLSFFSTFMATLNLHLFPIISSNFISCLAHFAQSLINGIVNMYLAIIYVLHINKSKYIQWLVVCANDAAIINL